MLKAPNAAKTSLSISYSYSLIKSTITALGWFSGELFSIFKYSVVNFKSIWLSPKELIKNFKNLGIGLISLVKNFKFLLSNWVFSCKLAPKSKESMKIPLGFYFTFSMFLLRQKETQTFCVMFSFSIKLKAFSNEKISSLSLLRTIN